MRRLVLVDALPREKVAQGGRWWRRRQHHGAWALAVCSGGWRLERPRNRALRSSQSQPLSAHAFGLGTWARTAEALAQLKPGPVAGTSVPRATYARTRREKERAERERQRVPFCARRRVNSEACDVNSDFNSGDGHCCVRIFVFVATVSSQDYVYAHQHAFSYFLDNNDSF